VELAYLQGAEGFPWIELACGADQTASALEALREYCPGLTSAMLEDLLTPDDEPEGDSYANGDIRLASSFGVSAQRPDEKLERGTPQGVGVLTFQPVELVAGSDWLITCWHPRRTFQGAEKIEEVHLRTPTPSTARWRRDGNTGIAEIPVTWGSPSCMSWR